MGAGSLGGQDWRGAECCGDAETRVEAQEAADAGTGEAQSAAIPRALRLERKHCRPADSSCGLHLITSR